MDINVVFFRFPGLERVRCAFQTRLGPDVTEGNISLEVGFDEAQTVRNREALLRLPGVCALAENIQVHGVKTVFEPKAHNPALPPSVEADGLASSSPGLALMVKTADCQPVLLAARDGSAVAALHIGWKGNRLSYPQVAVGEFCARYGIAPRDILAVRGPSLGPTAAEFIHFDQEWGADFAPWYNPEARTMDLWRLTRDQLVQAGLEPKNIFGLDMCTWTQTEDFFSFRRNRSCGRQASLIWLEA